MTSRFLHVVLVLAALLAASTFGVEAKVNVVTTTTDLADITRNVGGDGVTVESIARGYQNPHHVDARPSYLLMLRRANLFVQMGRDLEGPWALPLLQSSRNSEILPGARGFVDASTGVPIIMDFGGQQLDRSMGDVHPTGNPHYHLDPANIKIMARNIVDGLKRVDPDHAAAYESNLAAYVKKLAAESRKWAELARQIRGAKVVTYHLTWTYFAKRFGLNVVGTVEPKPGIAPSGAHLSALARTMKATGARVIIVEPYFNAKLADTLARETGAKIVVLTPSVGGEEGVNTYLELVTHQLTKLANALKS